MSVMEALLVRHPGEPTVGIWFIRRMTGHARKGEASLVRYVTGLIDNHGFPPPLPLFRNGGEIETGVASDSKWLRAAVMEWFEGFLPPTLCDALSDEAEEQAAAALDAAAASFGRKLSSTCDQRNAA